ncbi:MAG: zf-HC2 domain-containing protein, partial [Planctomycetota bacterium]|nr:zf-HC2 domain-containing protein [Planctomycetota bacterium]
MNECLKEIDIERYRADEMEAEERTRVEAHLSACSTCAAWASTGSEASKRVETYEPPYDPDESLLATPRSSSVERSSLSDTVPQDKSADRKMGAGTVSIEGYRIIRELAHGGMGVV